MDNVNNTIHAVVADLGLVLKAVEALEELLTIKATAQASTAEHVATIRKALSECHATATDLIASIDTGEHVTAEPVSTADADIV